MASKVLGLEGVSHSGLAVDNHSDREGVSHSDRVGANRLALVGDAPSGQAGEPASDLAEANQSARAGDAVSPPVAVCPCCLARATKRATTRTTRSSAAPHGHNASNPPTFHGSDGISLAKLCRDHELYVQLSSYCVALWSEEGVRTV